jgi:hypothetical protein
MQSINIDITLALILVIPVHGIFLSLFFFFRSGCNLTPDFFMGLFLVAISSLILFQIALLRNMSVVSIASDYLFLSELLICPFLFLYNHKVILPRTQVRIYLHLLFVILNFLLLFLIVSVSGQSGAIIEPIFITINGLYIAGSAGLLIAAAKTRAYGLTCLRIPDYNALLVFNLLVAATIMIAMVSDIIIHASIGYNSQIPKALTIYYIYFRILRKAVF